MKEYEFHLTKFLTSHVMKEYEFHLTKFLSSHMMALT